MNRLTVIAFSAAVALCGCATTKPDAQNLAACDLSQSNPIRSGVGCATPGKAVYTWQDLQRTGQTNLRDALGMLDPSLTVSHP
jgi:hypothetical protein